MPMFDYRCNKCDNIIEQFVKRHDDVVTCEECGEVRVKLFARYRYQIAAGDFFEPYVDTDIHPNGEPIVIKSKEDFFSNCRKHGRGWRKINDRMR